MMERMDAELAETLRSAELIVDIAATVQQLCENSVDAGAKGEYLSSFSTLQQEIIVDYILVIEVKIDCSKFTVSVSDDG